MAKNKNNLTIQQQNFVDKFLETNNASEAYRFAYKCKGSTVDTIKANACNLLKNTYIALTIEKEQARLQEKTDITKEQLLKELQTIKDTNILDYFEIHGNILRLKDLATLPIEQQKAIESIESTAYGVKLKLHSKTWSIERLCKMLGYDAPAKQEFNFGEDAAKIITGMQVN